MSHQVCQDDIPCLLYFRRDFPVCKHQIADDVPVRIRAQNGIDKIDEQGLVLRFAKDMLEEELTGTLYPMSSHDVFT